MIIESKDTIDKVLPYLPLRLGRAMAYLRDTDLGKLSDGRYEVEGSDIFVIISSYKTDKAESCILEAHFKYIDIQYLISGEELVYHSQIGAPFHKTVEKNVKKDMVIFEGSIEDENKYHLKAGQLMVFFPWDAHRTRCNAGRTACKVRKAVIKVRSES